MFLSLILARQPSGSGAAGGLTLGGGGYARKSIGKANSPTQFIVVFPANHVRYIYLSIYACQCELREKIFQTSFNIELQLMNCWCGDCSVPGGPPDS